VAETCRWLLCKNIIFIHQSAFVSLFLTCICLSARYFLWPWAPYRTAHVTSHRGHCPLWYVYHVLRDAFRSFLKHYPSYTYCCYAYHFFTHIGCTLLTCDMYMSDLRHTWSGTFILKDGRYTFLFFLIIHMINAQNMDYIKQMNRNKYKPLNTQHITNICLYTYTPS
jgi:hypothetical protein